MSGDGDDLRVDFVEIVRTFVDGALEGVERMGIARERGEVDADAEMVAALMDVAITLALRRGIPPAVIAKTVEVHARAILSRSTN